MSKQFRIVPVDSKTRTTPISRHFEKILCSIRNRLMPILNKILDNGRITTGHQVDEVIEEVCVMYYKQMKTEDGKEDRADSGEDGDGAALSRGDLTKTKRRFVGNVSWECIFTAAKFKRVLRTGPCRGGFQTPFVSLPRIKKGEDQGKYVTFSTMMHNEADENLKLTTSCSD